MKDNVGITYYGGTETSDFASFPLIPFYQVLFPVKIKSSIKGSRQGIDTGQDLDGDGITETADVNVKIASTGFEDVSTPVGEFTDCLKVVSTITLKVQSSAYPGRSFSVKVTGTEWYASGIGAVRRNIQLKVRAPGDKAIERLVVEDLIGYAVDGQKKGKIHITIAENISNHGTFTLEPTRTSISSDGTNFFVLYPCDDCSPAGLRGTILSGVGEKLASVVFPVSSIAAVAFDGTNYLVVTGREHQFLGFRVSPSGAILDPTDGFQISSGEMYMYDVAFGKDNYLAVWNNWTDATSHGIYGAIITTDGQVGAEFPIHVSSDPDGTLFHRQPSTGPTTLLPGNRTTMLPGYRTMGGRKSAGTLRSEGNPGWSSP